MYRYCVSSGLIQHSLAHFPSLQLLVTSSQCLHPSLSFFRSQHLLSQPQRHWCHALGAHLLLQAAWLSVVAESTRLSNRLLTHSALPVRNTVTITQGKSQDNTPNNDETATLRAWTPNLKVYNINLVNTRGLGSQALALSANADKQGYYGCQFMGYQDTILAQVGNQVYAKSYIEGATDFIFGQKATAWFENVSIGVLAASQGYVTANGRESDSNPSYYVINNSKIAAAPGNTVKAGAYFLGRPWRNYSRVVVQNTSMTNVINAAGWRAWNTDDPRTDKVTYGEYANTGDGSKGTRASFSKKLTAAVSVSTVLGSDYKNWVDAAYMS